jgi:hypothetical protein
MKRQDDTPFFLVEFFDGVAGAGAPGELADPPAASALAAGGPAHSFVAA